MSILLGEGNIVSADWKRRKRALLEGTAAGLIFGTAAIFIRFLHDVSIYTIAFGRVALASLLLVIIVKLFKQPSPIGLLQRFKREALFLGILLGLHAMLFASSVKNTTILNATVLVNTAPVQAAIVSSLAFGARPSKDALLGMLLSIVGILIIALGGLSLKFSVNLVGDLEALLAASCEAFYLNYGHRVRVKTSILPLMSILYLISTTTIVLSSLTMGSTVLTALTIEQLMFLVGLGILPTAIGHTLYFSALSGLKSFETATLALLEPIGATLLGVIIFSETPEPIFVMGAMLVLGGVALVVRR